jgi:hypothetical protein
MAIPNQDGDLVVLEGTHHHVLPVSRQKTRCLRFINALKSHHITQAFAFAHLQKLVNSATRFVHLCFGLYGGQFVLGQILKEELLVLGIHYVHAGLA